MADSTFAMDQAAYSSVSKLCDDFLRRSNAICALVVGQDGMILHRCGALGDLDLDGLAALSAGAFASGRELARIIGETTFDVAIQQGRRSHLQLVRVGDSAILVTVFDDRTTAGMVRLHGQRAARRLARVLAEGDAAGHALWPGDGGGGEGAGAGAEDEGRAPTEFLRQLQGGAEQLRTALRIRTLSMALALLAAIVAMIGALLRH